MHTLAVQLAPVLAAEKSKTPFYVAGGLLVAWALAVSLGLGLRKPDFPGSLGGQRAVGAISAVLVLAAVSTAVITSGGAAKSAAAATPTTTETQASSAAPAPASASSELKLAANPAGQLAYDTKQLSAKAGTVTIDMTNSSPVEHDVAVAEGGKIIGQTPVFTGGSKKLTLKLKPGTYTFFCTVPGHRQAGMEGTLSVS